MRLRKKGAKRSFTRMNCKIAGAFNDTFTIVLLGGEARESPISTKRHPIDSCWILPTNSWILFENISRGNSNLTQYPRYRSIEPIKTSMGRSGEPRISNSGFFLPAPHLHVPNLIRRTANSQTSSDSVNRYIHSLFIRKYTPGWPFQPDQLHLPIHTCSL